MVYIASDHPMLHYLLKNSQRLRREITRLFALGYATIWNENKVLWICAESPRSDVPDIVLDSLMELREALLKLNSQRAKMFFDMFYHRALMIEAAVWTVAGYALAAALENFFVVQDYHLHQSSLIYSGLMLALLMMAGLLVLSYLLLRRSSRAHRVIVETLIVGVISMPVAGIQLVSDLNRKLDSKPSIMIVDTVQDLTKRSSYASRRGRRKIYYLVPARNYNDQEVSLPSKIKINRQIFDQLHKGQRIRFEIGRGYLGHPWYRGIQFWK